MYNTLKILSFLIINVQGLAVFAVVGGLMSVSTPDNLSPQACPLRVSTGDFSMVIGPHGPSLGPEFTCADNSKLYGIFKHHLGTWNSLNSGYEPNVALISENIFQTWGYHIVLLPRKSFECLTN